MKQDYGIKPGLISRHVEGELVVLDPASGNVHRLNTVAAFIWGQLSAGERRAGIPQQVANRFDVELEQATADTDRFLGMLRSSGLIRITT